VAVTANNPPALWVQSDVAPDGTYVVGLHFGDDRAWVFTRSEAIQHAVAVLTQAERAEYDAAVLALLHGKLGMPLPDAGAFVANDLRPDRPPVDEPGPIALVPGVLARDLRGFLTLHLDGEPVGQWEIDSAHRHAVAVLQAVAAVDNDAAFYRLLRGPVGLEEPRARAVVADIANHRDETASGSG
jgi:hypothetical protein